MNHQDTGERRREDDFTQHRAETDTLYPGVDRRRRRPRARQRVPGRSFLRRFRHPIIGLSLAGAAAPLIDAGSPSPARPSKGGELGDTDTAPRAGESGDAEDALAAKIASEHHMTKRASIVGSAVGRYNITKDLASDIYDIAEREGIDPKLAYGLVKTESSFRQRAESHVGARGLTQVMPRTARWLLPGTKAEDLYDRRTNLALGFRYLNKMIDKYRGDVRLALLAYNRGPGTVDKILKRGGDPNNGYADKVLRG